MSSKTIIEQNSQNIAGGIVTLNRKAAPLIVFALAKGIRVFDIDGRACIRLDAII